MSLDLSAVRKQFPALDQPAIFFDNPGGTQIAKPSLARINSYLLECNANMGGAFKTSQQSDKLLREAHTAMADFLNASSPDEIVFGLNMTTLTMHISRSLAHRLNPGDEIVVTRMDHDANISPWLLIAEDHGCNITWVDFDVEEYTLNIGDFEKALEAKPKIVAFGYASNATGTTNSVHKLTKMAKDAGALVYIDAVQYAPHGLIDVQAIECDFLVCSAYKFFGPHVGILYGRLELLEDLKAYKLRPASNNPPDKWMTGTQNHEGIAGVLGALEYFEWLAENYGEVQKMNHPDDNISDRRINFAAAMKEIVEYELELSRALIEAISSVPGTHIHGLTDMDRLEERVPTVSFTLEGKHPRQIAEALGKEGIYVWDGNYYALAVTERLGLESSGGMLRIGAAHYNTLDEVGTFADKLNVIAGN